ncbi:MAG: sel1 repeat family protein [Parachlamydiaceae bacterium]|nr:sel1 repeat family protein [Parachlamydiaceae bacterium]
MGATENDPFSQSALAEAFENGWGVKKSFEEAFKYYLLAAAQGFSIAQYYIGNCYKWGKGVEQSKEESLKYYNLSTEQG